MNVVLDEYLNVEIIDFGQSYISAPNQVNTSVSRIAGSSLWMAPELRAARTDSIAGRSVNLAGKKVDFWSLGAIIYDLLASAGDSVGHLWRSNSSDVNDYKGKGWCLEVADHVHAHPGDVHTVIAPIESPRARDMIAGVSCLSCILIRLCIVMVSSCSCLRMIAPSVTGIRMSQNILSSMSMTGSVY